VHDHGSDELVHDSGSPPHDSADIFWPR